MAATDQGPGRAGAGALGPRLAGRLTAELIMRSPQFMSPIKLYEIDLRGNKIAVIENLGATENQFDSIDLSDNAIVRLEGFPRLPRLKQLLLHNNRLARIGKNCHEPILNLEVLMLTNNKLSNLQDLDPLAHFPKLSMLSLVGNPVMAKPNYRLYVIARCKALKVLDFKKVKQQERQEAAKLFPTEEAAAEHGAKTFEVDADFEEQQRQLDAAQQKEKQQQGDQQDQQQKQPAAAGGEGGKGGPTAEQLVAIKAAIANAATMEEIRRLEEALTTGQVPSEFVIDKDTAGDTVMGNGTAAPATTAVAAAEGVAAAAAVEGNGNGSSNDQQPGDMAIG